MDEKQDRPKTTVEELDFLNDVIPYRCPKCGDNRKFSKLGDLKLHLETDHSYKLGFVKPRTRVKVFSHSAAKGGNKGKTETYLKKFGESNVSFDNSWKNGGTGSEKSDCESRIEKRSGKEHDQKRSQREVSPLLQSYKQDAKTLEMKIKMAKENEMKRRLERNILDNKSNYEFRNSLSDMNTEVLQARQKEWQMADALYQSHDVLLSMEQAAEKRCREQQEVIQDIVNEFKFKENQLAQANTDLEKLKCERERLMVETENLLKSADKGQEHLQEELTKREEMLSSISDELEVVKVVATQEIQKKDGELAETKEKLETLASERDLLIKETAELSDKAGQHSSLLKRTLEVKERQLRKVNKEMEKLKTEQNSLVEESINLYKTANEGNNKLKELVKSKENQLNEAYQELGQMKELHEKLVWEANQLTKQADENNEKLKALFRKKEEQLLDAQVELERVRVEQNMLLESAKGLQDKVESADEKVTELQSVVSQKEQQLAQKEKELESIQSFLSLTAKKESVARNKLEKFISELIDRADTAERELIVLKSRSNSDTSGSPKHLPKQQPIQNNVDSDADVSCQSSVISSSSSDSLKSSVKSKTKSVLPDSKMGIQISSLPLGSLTSDILSDDDSSSAHLPQNTDSLSFPCKDISRMKSKTGNIPKEEVHGMLHSGIDLNDVPYLVNTTGHEQETLDDISRGKRRTGSNSRQTNKPQHLPKDLTQLHRKGPNVAPRKPPRQPDCTSHCQQEHQESHNHQNEKTIPIQKQQNFERYPRQFPESQSWKNADSGQLKNPEMMPIHQQQVQERISIQLESQNPENSKAIRPPPEFLDSDDIYSVVRLDGDDLHAYNSMPQNQDFHLEQGFRKTNNLRSNHENNIDGNMSPVYLEELGEAKINLPKSMKSEEILLYSSIETGSKSAEMMRGNYFNDPLYVTDTVTSKPENTHYPQKIKSNTLYNHYAHRRKPYEHYLYDGHRNQNDLAESFPRERTPDSQKEAFNFSKFPDQFNGHTAQNKTNLLQNGEEGNTVEYENSVVSDCLTDNIENSNISKRPHSERLVCTGNNPQHRHWQCDINVLNADIHKYDTVNNTHISESNSHLPPFSSSKMSNFGSENKFMHGDSIGQINEKMLHLAENKGQTMYIPYEVEKGKPVPVLPTMPFQNIANTNGRPRKPVSNIQQIPYQSKTNMDKWTGKPVSDVQPMSFQNNANIDRWPGNTTSDTQPLPFGNMKTTEGHLLSRISHEPVKRMVEDEYQSGLDFSTNSHSLSDLIDDEDDPDYSLNDVVSIPEYENFFTEPEDNENSISEFHEIMDDNGIVWDMKYSNTDIGIDRKNENTPTWTNHSNERDKRGLHVRFKNENQNDVTKFNLKSRSAESLASFSSDSYMPIQRRNVVMPNSSETEIFDNDLDELTDFNTRYNSKSPSLESLKSVSSDSYLPVQKRGAGTQTFSDNIKYPDGQKSDFNESNSSLKSPSTGSFDSVSSDSFVPFQRRDAKTQTALHETKHNLKSPSAESMGSFSSDSYIPLAKYGTNFEIDSRVYNTGVPLSGRISPKHVNLPKTRNSSTQTWLLDRHITGANIELIRERSPLVENRTLLDENYKNSQFLSDAPRNEIKSSNKSNDNYRLGEFTKSDRAMLISEIDRRIEEKLQIRNKVLHDSESTLSSSQANEIHANENMEFNEGDRNGKREQTLGKHSDWSNDDSNEEHLSSREVSPARNQKDLSEERSTPSTELKVLSHDSDSVTKTGNVTKVGDKTINLYETLSKTESKGEKHNSEGNKDSLRSSSVNENSLQPESPNKVPLDKKTIFTERSNNDTSEYDNDKVFKDTDAEVRKIKQEVMPEEKKNEEQLSPVSMETLDDSGVNFSSSNDFSTDGVHEENIHRHVSPRTYLKHRSFSIDDDGSCTHSEKSYPSDNSKLETEISSYEIEDSQNKDASIKIKSAEKRQRKTGMVTDEQCLQLDHTYGGNNVETSWMAEQKQSQDAMLTDLTDTDEDYCQSLTSLEDFRERFSMTSSLDSRLDTTIYKKREEIRNRRNALFHIFSFLDTKSLIDVALVCREWRKVSRQQGLWKKVSLTYRKISTKFLMTISSWCTHTEHLILEGLQPRDMYEGESREGYSSKISGSLEPGLERLLQQSESTLKSIRIVNCGKLLTDKSIWLVSCYSRVIKSICYISDTYPLGADVMWAVGSGCRDINTLIIPPKYPCSSPEKFDNKCLQIISQCCHDLEKLSIGGSLIDINGLVLVAKSCQRLLELEFHYGNDITEDIATAICRLGLNPLQCLRFIHTPVDDKAILQFYKSCKHLKLIQIDLSASDYVDDLVNEDNVKIFKKYSDKLTKLSKKPGLGNILRLHLNDAS